MFMSRKHKKTAWVSKTRTIEKPWGKERVWSGFTGVHGKTLFIKAGSRTSFKCFPAGHQEYADDSY